MRSDTNVTAKIEDWNRSMRSHSNVTAKMKIDIDLVYHA